MNIKLPTIAEGEELIWVGRPEEYKDYRKLDRVFLPLCLLLLVFGTVLTAYTVYSAICSGLKLYHFITSVFIAVIVLFGLYGYFFRFLVKRANKRRLVYGVTSMGRVLIRDMKTFDCYDFSGYDVEEAYISEVDSNGVGTIYLSDDRHLLDNMGFNFLIGRDTNMLALYDVADCVGVLDKIQGN